MNPEVLAYPFLFIAIFFESFILITLLSKPARLARIRAGGRAEVDTLPTVAIIVPCWNEETTLAATCESLLALDYPTEKLEIILSDDGSTDRTPEVMATFADHPQVRIISKKENGGKHTALNAGVALTSAEFIGCLDADSFVEPGALQEIISCFSREKVAAVTAALSVHNPKSILAHMQNAEYFFGIAYRHTFASINGLYVTPGPFSFYRRAVIERLGGFRHGHQTEDMEMALRLQRENYEIENAPRARVYTKVPLTVGALIKQRTRWTTGFLRNVFGEYRSLLGNRQNPTLGMLVLPGALLSVGSSILLFLIMFFTLGQNVVHAIETQSGIPLSYTLIPHNLSFDWFYLPISVYAILGILVLLISLSFILVGKYISKTPGKLTMSLLSYIFLYGLIAPLWLSRATVDASFGTRRGWRW
ncbi:glycosyltransferase [Candidatus Kaiserbacteria bacterium]|nr:glycosyltransferase [Candidatus Kaiserbacteria bacterium]